MSVNQEITEKLENPMFHYRKIKNAKVESSVAKAATKIRQLEEPVEQMSRER